MRKSLAVVGVVVALALGGCGGATETDSGGQSVVTQPATQARDTVAQQNEQLQQMEQQTSQADPTVP